MEFRSDWRSGQDQTHHRQGADALLPGYAVASVHPPRFGSLNGRLDRLSAQSGIEPEELVSSTDWQIALARCLGHWTHFAR